MVEKILNRVSVRQNIHRDEINAYDVTYNIGEDIKTDEVHTDKHGQGLWINGKQIEGICQFSGGRNVAGAIRRWYQSTVLS